MVGHSARPYRFVLGSEQAAAALDAVVQTMCVGETRTVRVPGRLVGAAGDVELWVRLLDFS